MSVSVSRRSFLSLCALALASLFCPLSAQGFERREHDNITREILFGQPSKHQKKSVITRGLEGAVYLCADQMKMDGEDDLARLKKQNIPNLPQLEDIALTSDYMELAGGFFGYHDAMTHMGWHFDYSDPEALKGSAAEAHVRYGYGKKWPGRWRLRKKLLVNSVAHLLDFGFIDRARAVAGWADGTICDAFAELLYYIHLLGDYQDKIQDNLKKGKYEMGLLALPFAVKEPDEDNRDFFWDLEEAVTIIFDNNETHEECDQVLFELRKRATMARSSATVASKTSAETFRRHVLMTRRMLKQHIPGMLAKTPFFSNVFYIDEEADM